MSKHKANEKIAILEFIQARLKDIIISDHEYVAERFHDYVLSLERYGLPQNVLNGLNELDEDIKGKIVADLIVKVYDPFTTEMDFNILLDMSWTKYEEIYGKYYNEEKHGPLEQQINEMYEGQTKILALIHNGEPNGVFNASSSESIIFHTITEMREILGLDLLPEP